MAPVLPKLSFYENSERNVKRTSYFLHLTWNSMSHAATGNVKMIRPFDKAEQNPWSFP